MARKVHDSSTTSSQRASLITTAELCSFRLTLPDPRSRLNPGRHVPASDANVEFIGANLLLPLSDSLLMLSNATRGGRAGQRRWKPAARHVDHAG